VTANRKGQREIREIRQIGENNEMDQKVSKALLTPLDDVRATDDDGVRGSG